VPCGQARKIFLVACSRLTQRFWADRLSKTYSRSNHEASSAEARPPLLSTQNIIQKVTFGNFHFQDFIIIYSVKSKPHTSIKMKFTSSAITLLAVVSSAAAFAPILSSRSASVAVQSSLSNSLDLEKLTSEVSGMHL
jgi:hypothetical protein